jgi:DNA-binding transcriptional MocR family regulator
VTRYRELANELADLIRHGTLRTGDRVPSVRTLTRERGISPATVMRAYETLEAAGLVETRPRSGYYVSALWQRPAHEPRISKPSTKSTRVDIDELVFDILESTRHRDVVPLGSAFPSPTLFPWAKLARHLGSSARHMDPWSTVDSLPPGNEELRRQIAQRYLAYGTRVSSDEIVITSGALEGLNLSLQIVTKPGDTVAIESPSFYGCLQAIQAAGLKAVEIPTHPRDGVDVAALAAAIAKHDIKACWFMTSFQNPTGATAPAEAKRALVSLLGKHEIPLIEDDVYAELYFGRDRPKSAKAFDTKGLVLSCGSFSKSLAPGYRLGWVVAGRFAQQLQRRKITSTLATSIPIQNGIALALRQETFDTHLERLRRALETQQRAMVACVRKHFPAHRLTIPTGGYFLWIELDGAVDALEIQRRALAANISVAPGPMFSARREFRNFLRLNYGHPWNSAVERAMVELGTIIRGSRKTEE